LKNALQAEFKAAQVNGYLLERPSPPCFDVDIHEDGINFDQSMHRGIDEWWFKVTALCATGSTLAAQKTRDGFLKSSGTGSVKAALETDRTLGGVVQSLHVTNVVPRTLAAADTDALYLGAEFTVRILAAGV
jgi:hypothetical protein